MKRLLVGFMLAYLLGLALILTWDTIEANRYEHRLLPSVDRQTTVLTWLAEGCTWQPDTPIVVCDRFRLR